MINEYLMLQGQLYLAQRAGSDTPYQFTPMGNAPAITLTLGAGALPQPYSLPSGGRPVTLLSDRESNEPPSIAFDLENVTRDNLALALYGTAATSAGGTVAAETIVVRTSMTNFLANMNITSWGTLKDTSSTFTYVRDKDYVLDTRYGTLTIPAGSAIGDGASLRAAYTYGSVESVKPFSAAPAPVWLRFAGINQATGKPVMADIYKVQFKPLDSMGLIDDDAKSISLFGTILRDYYNPADPQATRLFDLRKA